MKFIRKLADNLLTIAENCSAAHTDQRFTGTGQYIHNLADLKIIALHCRLITTDTDFIHRHIFYLLLLNIQRYINQNRSPTSCRCNMECLLENTWDLSGISHQIAVFDKRFRRTCNICLLKDILAKEFT